MRNYILWVCVFSPRYPARNAHAPYCHLWPVRLCSIFPHYLINGTIFEKKIMQIKMCFFLQLLPGIYFILGNTERDMIKRVDWFVV